MTLWVCTDCTTVYSVGAPACPHCRSVESIEQGEPMPKITKHGGASDETLPPPDAIVRTKKQLTEEQAKVLAEAVQDGAEPLPFGATLHPVREARAGEALPPVPDEAYPPDVVPLAEEEVPSSPGSSSSASTEKPPTVSEPNAPAAPKPAPRTGSRSGKGRMASSSARSTAGEKTAAPSDN